MQQTNPEQSSLLSSNTQGDLQGDQQAGPQGDSQAGPAAKRRTRKNAWVVTASCLLAAFTTFVLLDTFVIGRVQQTVQEADYSSIIAAQSSTTTTQGVASPLRSSSSANASGDSSAASDASSAASSSASSSAESSSSSSSRSGAHGGKSHGSRGGKPGSGSSSGSGGKPSGKSSGSSSSTTTDVSQVVAGAASATSAGTSLGNYADDNVSIKVSSVRAYNTDIYVADVQVSSAEYLKTALAQNSFGRNLKDTTSNMAEAANAILAINGDYYGFRDDGYVLRNGVLYRDTASSGTDALVVYGDGTMAAASQDDKTAQQLKEAGAWQILSFGPVLVDNGQIAVAANEEVGQAKNSNPRTAIGMISPLHYVVVVSDGRTGDNEGLSLYELAQVLIDNGATFAYNLDGGGSTTLYFEGKVINNPTSGNIGGERSVSDIVYFG